MTDNFDWTNGIVAIYGDKSQPVGTGFVVSADGLIATCAHVLDDASWPYEEWAAPVQVRFRATGRYADALVLEECYRPQTRGDVAILALQEPLPTGVEALELSAARGAIGREVFTWGYPKYGTKGLGGIGRVVALVPGDLGEVVQIDSTTTTRGYSGGPVWNESSRTVIGMVLKGLEPEADASGRHPYTNFAAPAERLVELSQARLNLITVLETETEADRQALEAYLGMIAGLSNRLPLGPLDPAGQESAYLSLAQVYIDLDAGLGKRIGQEYRMDTDVLYTAAVGHARYNRRLILLGDPGSGKTTFLRFLALVFAKAALEPGVEWLGRLRWTEHSRPMEERIGQAWPKDFFEMKSNTVSWTTDSPLPIFITIRDFARESFDSDSPLAIWNHVANRLRLEGLAESVEPLRKRALAGEVVFLLDGVDEVPLARRAAVWQAIVALENGPYGRNRWLASCRNLSFSKSEAPVGAPVQTLQPLDENQINAFIEAWYGALAESGTLAHQEAQSHTVSLTAAASRSALRPLARNPMLLTIMAVVQTYYGTLPEERARLYQACVETLLLRWQRIKEMSAEGEELPEPLAVLGATQEDLQRLVWEIAWVAHNETAGRDDTADIPESRVMAIAKKQLGSYAKAEAFLEYTEQRAHLLISRGGADERVYAFPHRTFQEYLAACHLASGRRFPSQAAGLAEDPSMWRETLNLAAGTLVFNRSNRERALDGVEGVMPRGTPEPDDEAGWNRVWMAGEMMSVVGRSAAEKDEVGQEILPCLREQLVALLEGERLAPAARAEAGEALGRIGDPRPGVYSRLPDMIVIPQGPFLMGQLSQEISLLAFAIARYPVTNAQFRFFVEDGGYTDRWQGCWTADGWQWRQREGCQAPRFWDDGARTIDNKPVVGVSWYEAVAYANWLSQLENRAFGLPTEAQWERAARHTDGRQYPWGDVWRDGIANSSEAGIGRTTAVGCFSGARAVCGADDMSGNVWEWCSTRFKVEGGPSYPPPYRDDDGREELRGSANVRRVHRGGASYDSSQRLRVIVRLNSVPHLRSDVIGFRVAEQLQRP